jgi:hypothetical protein
VSSDGLLLRALQELETSITLKSDSIVVFMRFESAEIILVSDIQAALPERPADCWSSER